METQSIHTVAILTLFLNASYLPTGPEVIGLVLHILALRSRSCGC
jgi:hypothetical protein